MKCVLSKVHVREGTPPDRTGRLCHNLLTLDCLDSVPLNECEIRTKEIMSVCMFVC